MVKCAGCYKEIKDSSSFRYGDEVYCINCYKEIDEIEKKKKLKDR